MGSFRRTKSGINNLFLFYDVDYIVYLEGGKKSFNKSEVYENRENYTADSEDISFWSNIFSKHKKNKSFKFKSIGSKKTLQEISQDLISGEIQNIYIAMDNEFDQVLNKQISHPNIIYTHGYSYENDIWNTTTIIDVLKDLTASEVSEKYIFDGIQRFIKDIKKGVFSDFYLFKKKMSFFERRSGILFCIECNIGTAFPSVKKDVIEERICAKNLNINTIRKNAYKNKIKVLNHCFGHLLADFACQVINHYIKFKHGFNTVSKEILYRMGIKNFFRHQYDSSLINEYYALQFAR